VVLKTAKREAFLDSIESNMQLPVESYSTVTNWFLTEPNGGQMVGSININDSRKGRGMGKIKLLDSDSFLYVVNFQYSNTKSHITAILYQVQSHDESIIPFVFPILFIHLLF